MDDANFIKKSPADDDASTVSAIEWHPQQENILKRWAETAMVFSLMHDAAHRKYRMKSLAFTLPVIVLSSVTGTANFATTSFDPDHRYKLSMIIGCLNLLSGLVTTIAQFLRINELCESHRAANVAFSKFHRSVSITLSLPLYDRPTSGTTFLESSRQEYDRLLEQSPVVPLKIVDNFKKEMELAGMDVPIFGIVPVTVYQQTEDETTIQDTLSNVRQSLCRLKTLRGIDRETELSIMREVDRRADEKEEQPYCCTESSV